MKINAFVFRGMAIGVLCTAGLAGCQKEAAVNEDRVTTSKVTPALTVGLPSVIVGWGALQNSIPYLDHSTGGDVTYVQSPQGFTINGIGFVCGGRMYNNGVEGGFSPELFQYDPVGNKWHAMAAFPGNSRMSAACFTVDGKGYLVGGLHVVPGNRGLGTTVWQYTPGGVGVNGSWKEMKVFPGSARYEANGAAATIGGADVGFVVGGVASGDVVQGDVWTYYPPGDSWNKEPNIAGGPRANPAVFVIGHSLFVANENVDVMGWSR